VGLLPSVDCLKLICYFCSAAATLRLIKDFKFLIFRSLEPPGLEGTEPAGVTKELLSLCPSKPPGALRLNVWILSSELSLSFPLLTDLTSPSLSL
jgi:hypothetical protein